MKKIKLTQGKYALVDDQDYEELNKYKWHIRKRSEKPSNKAFYAVTTVRIVGSNKQTALSMHRVITKCPPQKVIDHIDGDGLNNQRNNLRIVTHAENIQNSGKRENNKSGYKGVYWLKSHKKWNAQIGVNNKKIHLGLYTTAEEAYKAYCEACVKYHKEFARLDKNN